MNRNIVLAALLVFLALTACGGSGDGGSQSGTDRPARAVESYLNAKVQGDQDGIRSGLCSAMEADLERELHAFETVSNATIENMSCASDDPSAQAETTVRSPARSSPCTAPKRQTSLSPRIVPLVRMGSGSGAGNQNKRQATIGDLKVSRGETLPNAPIFS